jgi:hypothetical protein
VLAKVWRGKTPEMPFESVQNGQLVRYLKISDRQTRHSWHIERNERPD